MTEILQEIEDKILLFRYTKPNNFSSSFNTNYNINNNISSYDKNELIRVLIIGPRKSGKKFLLNKIANKFNQNFEKNNFLYFEDILIKIFDSNKDDLNKEIFNSSIIIYITNNYTFQNQEELLQIKKSKYYNINTKIIIIHNIYIQFLFTKIQKYYENIFKSTNKNYFNKINDSDIFNKFFDNDGFLHLILGDFESKDEDVLLNQNDLALNVLYDIINYYYYYKIYLNDFSLMKKQSKFYPDYFYGIKNNKFFINVINHYNQNLKIEAKFDNKSIIEFTIKCVEEKKISYFKKTFKNKINEDKYEINFSVYYKDYPIINFKPEQTFKNGMVSFTFQILEIKNN
jgi:hypothetical protein